MNELSGLREFVKFIHETGFVLFFALYSLFRHDKTLKELTQSIIELRELLRAKQKE